MDGNDRFARAKRAIYPQNNPLLQLTRFYSTHIIWPQTRLPANYELING